MAKGLHFEQHERKESDYTGNRFNCWIEICPRQWLGFADFRQLQQRSAEGSGLGTFWHRRSQHDPDSHQCVDEATSSGKADLFGCLRLTRRPARKRRGLWSARRLVGGEERESGRAMSMSV